jgi:hypothetical protein
MSANTILQSILTISLVVVGLWIAFWVYKANKNSRANTYLSIVIVLSILFIFSDYLAFFTEPALTTLLERIAYGLAPIAVCVLYLFSLDFPEKSKNNIFITVPIVIYSIFFAISSIFSNGNYPLTP